MAKAIKGNKQGANFKTNDVVSGKICLKDFKKGQFIFFICDILSSLALHLIKNFKELFLQDQFFFNLPLIYSPSIHSNQYFPIGLFYFKNTVKTSDSQSVVPGPLHQITWELVEMLIVRLSPRPIGFRNSGSGAQQSVLSGPLEAQV